MHVIAVSQIYVNLNHELLFKFNYFVCLKPQPKVMS
jgi:hypothetical protein